MGGWYLNRKLQGEARAGTEIWKHHVQMASVSGSGPNFLAEVLGHRHGDAGGKPPQGTKKECPGE